MANRKAFHPVLLCALVAACSETSDPTDAPALAFSYGSPGCFPGMTPTQICQMYHGTSSTATTYCVYGDCFDMGYGELAMVVAADEQGEYPRTWFMWTDCTLTTTVGHPPCLLTEEGRKKTRVDIPAGSNRCMTSAFVGSDQYFAHFASNPTSQCLAWLECKVPAVPVP